MKILHVIDSGGLYGAEIMLMNLITEQALLGTEAVICSIAGPGEQEKPLEAEAMRRGIKVEKVRMRGGLNVAGIRSVLRFAGEKGFSLLHSHGYKPDILFGFIPRALRGLPMVTTLHGWTGTGSFSRMSFYHWLDSLSFKWIDAVVLVSDAMISDTKYHNVGRANAFVVPNGISPPALYSGCEVNANSTHGSPCEEDPIPAFCSKGFIIGAAGRLSQEKGFTYLIDAVRMLKKKNMDVRLVIMGEGRERAALQAKIDTLDLGDTILLPGYRGSAFRYMPLFHLFAIPSLAEGTPIVMLEAMHARVPMVTTCVGSMPEALQYGKGGLLVEPRDSAALAEAACRIYNNAELAERLTAYSYDEVNKTYSARNMALRYQDIYENVLGQH